MRCYYYYYYYTLLKIVILMFVLKVILLAVCYCLWFHKMILLLCTVLYSNFKRSTSTVILSTVLYCKYGCTQSCFFEGYSYSTIQNTDARGSSEAVQSSVIDKVSSEHEFLH